MANPTTNYNWTLPTVGSSTGTWGTTLNALFQFIDDQMLTTNTIAAAALPVAGGTMTGPVKVLEVNDTVVNKGTSVSGAVTLDLETGNVFYGTMDGSITSVEVTNPPASGTGFFVILELTNAGFNISWGSEHTYEWPGGSAPTPTATGKDTYVLYSYDGGTTVVARRCIEDAS